MNSNPLQNLPEANVKPMLGTTCFSNGIVTPLKSAEIYDTCMGEEKQGLSYMTFVMGNIKANCLSSRKMY